jgi:hypothetical protein
MSATLRESDEDDEEKNSQSIREFGPEAAEQLKEIYQMFEFREKADLERPVSIYKFMHKTFSRKLYSRNSIGLSSLQSTSEVNEWGDTIPRDPESSFTRRVKRNVNRKLVTDTDSHNCKKKKIQIKKSNKFFLTQDGCFLLRVYRRWPLKTKVDHLKMLFEDASRYSRNAEHVLVKIS